MLLEETIPELAPNQVHVKVAVIGLNLADIFAILGLYIATPDGSYILGLEYSGVVHQIGSDVKNFKSGDKVMGVTCFGGYTTDAVNDEDYLVTLPENWAMEERASYLVHALTANYGLFHLGNLAKGDTVFIHSAAGGVGLIG